LDRNIWSAGGELKLSISYSAIREMRRNFFWSASGQIRWDLHDRRSNLERHDGPVVFPPKAQSNRVADPCLEIGDAGLVRVPDRSPARAFGIQTMDLSGVGPQRLKRS